MVKYICGKTTFKLIRKEMKLMRRKDILIFVFALVLGFNCGSTIIANGKIKSLQNQLSKVEGDRHDIDLKINQLETEVSDLREYFTDEAAKINLRIKKIEN